MNASDLRAFRAEEERLAQTKALGQLQTEVAEIKKTQAVVLSHVTSQTYFGVRSPLPMLALAFASAALFGVIVLSTAFAYVAFRTPNQNPNQTQAKL
jgi:hypothetical protein